MDRKYFTQLTSRLYRLTLFFPKDDPLGLEIRKLGTDVLANLVFILEGAFYQSRDLINNAQKDIEALDCFFDVVKTLDWVNSSDLLEIKKEYSKIGGEIKKISEIQSMKIGEIQAFQMEAEKKELVGQKKLLGEKNPGENSEKEEPESEEIELSQLEFRNSKTRNSEVVKETVENSISEDLLLERQQKILKVLKEKEKAQVGDFKEVFPEVSKRTLRRDFRFLVDQGFVERIGEANETFYQLKSVR